MNPSLSLLLPLQASVFNTVNYNVSLARAWTAIALQQRRFLRDDLQEELKRMQSDVLSGVLNQIRDLVRKRKHALAVSSDAAASSSSSSFTRFRAPPVAFFSLHASDR